MCHAGREGHPDCPLPTSIGPALPPFQAWFQICRCDFIPNLLVLKNRLDKDFVFQLKANLQLVDLTWMVMLNNTVYRVFAIDSPTN